MIRSCAKEIERSCISLIWKWLTTTILGQNWTFKIWGRRYPLHLNGNKFFLRTITPTTVAKNFKISMKVYENVTEIYQIMIRYDESQSVYKLTVGGCVNDVELNHVPDTIVKLGNSPNLKPNWCCIAMVVEYLRSIMLETLIINMTVTQLS